MPIKILMPALSPTMEHGSIAKWLKKEGDNIVAGEVILEVETDKATMDMETPTTGYLATILVTEGTSDIQLGRVSGCGSLLTIIDSY